MKHILTEEELTIPAGGIAPFYSPDPNFFSRG